MAKAALIFNEYFIRGTIRWQSLASHDKWVCAGGILVFYCSLN